VPVSFKQKLADLKELGAADDETAKRGIRKALGDANTYIVSEAAALARRRSHDDLIPDLLVAYDRLFDPTPDEPDLSLDPLASGKHSIATALKDLGYREAAPFLRGLDHVQREPAYGGKVDVAADMRCTCAQALVGCDVDPDVLLERLIPHLIEPEMSVRVETARAIGAVGGPAGALLLRLKALVGDKEPEVTGECLRALLAMPQRDTIDFVAGFLRAGSNGVRLEAFAALAECREPAALRNVRAALPDEPDEQVRRGTVLAIGASPLPEAAEFLLSLIVAEPRALAVAALEALGASRFAHEFRMRAGQAASETGDPALARAFATAFASLPSGTPAV
jgi:HEAT repeat protein